MSVLAETSDFIAFSVRKAGPDDCALLWRWRNHPRVRAASFDDRVIPLAEHTAWFERALADPARAILVIEDAGAPVSCVRFDRIAGAIRVSIFNDPSRVGGGIGAPALQAAEDWVRANWPDARRIVAEIRPDNVRSQRAFAKAGYCPSGEAFVRILEAAP
jgi:RimJ/RimL family protein N-acetyltransferase